MNDPKNSQKKLSLSDFMKRSKDDSKSDLSKIAGGILGACHTVQVCVYHSDSTTSVNYYNN